MPIQDKKQLRILHYPTDVGGNPTGLSRAERKLGACSTVAAHRTSWLGNPIDINLDIAAKPRPIRLLRQAQFFASCINRYDVFHFNYGKTFLPHLTGRGIDLPLLRLLGKRIFMTYQGCDARQADSCAVHDSLAFPIPDGHRAEPCPTCDGRKRKYGVRYVSRYAHKIFCLNPDLVRIVPRSEFIPYASVDVSGISPAPSPNGKRLTIVHAPTDRAIKGTDHIIASITALSRHHDIELVLVENMPHAKALQMYRNADLAIDQMRVGWYGTFSVEMMALGKPVVCYIREDDLGFIPLQMASDLPVIRANPLTLTDVLTDICTHRERLRDIGNRSRAFVERWHNPDKIAERMLHIYQNPSASFWSNAVSDSASARRPDKPMTTKTSYSSDHRL